MKISVFYASGDHEAMVEVSTYLRAVAERSDDVWDDGKIEPWDEWTVAIAERLQITDVAIFLISENFFTSKFLQHVEGAASTARERLRLRAVRVPILVQQMSDDDFVRHQWTKQMRFTNTDGKLVPFCELKNADKHLKLKLELKEARGKLAAAGKSGTMQRLDLTGEMGQSRAAKKMAHDYSERPDLCIRRAVMSYLKLRRRLGGPQLAKRWGKLVFGNLSGHPAMNDDHRAILDLLNRGLPESPVHLENFAPTDPSLKLIMTAGIAPLLNGLKILESDYSAAERLITEEPRHRTCALAHCALGQCYRKKDRFSEAQHHLKRAGELAAAMKSHCSCGLKCPKSSILAEAQRGLGTVHRKGGDFDRAQQDFDLALKACENDDVSPKQRSGVHYSFGYFLLERGISCWNGTEEGAEKVRHVMSCGFDLGDGPSEKATSLLTEALRHFELADQLNRGAGPACARKAIVELLLHLPKHEEDFVSGAKQAGDGPEGRLTRFFCQVGSFLIETKKGHKPPESDMKKAAKDLLDLFLGDKEVAEGPRQCHAFDLQLVTCCAQLKKVLHPDLARSAGLLIQSASWPRLAGIEEQHRRANEWNQEGDTGP